MKKVITYGTFDLFHEGHYNILTCFEIFSCGFVLLMNRNNVLFHFSKNLLVVFNHIIAFQLVKADQVVRFVWYGITIFHMPAFIFISGYLSKKPQDVMKNVKNLLIPYILGYTLTWAAQIWLGNKMDYELLRPSGTVMWYVLRCLYTV